MAAAAGIKQNKGDNTDACINVCVCVCVRVGVWRMVGRGWLIIIRTYITLLAKSVICVHSFVGVAVFWSCPLKGSIPYGYLMAVPRVGHAISLAMPCATQLSHFNEQIRFHCHAGQPRRAHCKKLHIRRVWRGHNVSGNPLTATRIALAQHLSLYTTHCASHRRNCIY